MKCRQLYALGHALRKIRKWTQARTQLLKAITACAAAKSDLEPWARHIAGKADERLSNELAAARHYREQMARHPDHRLADDGGYYVIRHIVEDLEDLKQAERELKGLVFPIPQGGHDVRRDFLRRHQRLCPKEISPDAPGLGDGEAPRLTQT